MTPYVMEMLAIHVGGTKDLVPSKACHWQDQGPIDLCGSPSSSPLTGCLCQLVEPSPFPAPCKAQHLPQGPGHKEPARVCPRRVAAPRGMSKGMALIRKEGVLWGQHSTRTSVLSATQNPFLVTPRYPSCDLHRVAFLGSTGHRASGADSVSTGNWVKFSRKTEL